MASADTVSKSMTSPLPDLPSGAVQFAERFCLRNEITGEPLKNAQYEMHFDDGSMVSGVTDNEGLTSVQNRLSPAKIMLKVIKNQH